MWTLEKLHEITGEVENFSVFGWPPRPHNLHSWKGGSMYLNTDTINLTDLWDFITGITIDVLNISECREKKHKIEDPVTKEQVDFGNKNSKFSVVDLELPETLTNEFSDSLLPIIRKSMVVILLFF